ncbi:histidine kinase [Micromonospora auratinigra]|uniref:histidine kinase n=1 Tax=Micromonospora auratinigra TaxID=261654 RepID=UPI001E38D740|nr:histidine kinase [Micromonospora auratinigra]
MPPTDPVPPTDAPDGPASALRRRRLGDLLLWVVLAAPVTYAGLTPPWPGSALVRLAGSLALLAGAVAVGRRLPLAALVAVVLGSFVDGNFVFAIPVLSYLAGRRSPGTGRVAVVFGVIAVAGTALNLGLLGTDPSTWFLLASILLVAGVFPWLLGRYRRQQAALADAQRRHAEAVRRERRGVTDRVRLRERARIAEEMHDSLGHELSLIALRAAALELAADLPAAHRAAAGELRARVAAATERLHEIIGVLREDRAGSARPPDETVADLVEGARDAGMAVALRTGAGPVDLPPLTAHAVHRVVREALTNAARYAPGAPVTVAVQRRAGAVAVDVVNGASPTGPLPGPAAHGSGLLALRERVRLAGGSFDAGPRGGGFAVTAHLPLHPPPAGPVPAGDDRSVGVPVPAGDDMAVVGSVSSADEAATGRTAPGTGPAGPRRPAWSVEDEGEDGPDDGRSDPAAEAERRLGDARRRVRHSLLVAFGAPALLGLVLALVYYPLAATGAELDRAGYERLRVGAARDGLGLPRRQVPPPTADAPPGCEYYTDGNFPFARPTWRLCFADGRLVSKEWIAR